MSWVELAGYTRADGKYETERPLGQTLMPGPKIPPPAAGPLTGRAKLRTLKAGAYRVRLEGEDAAGQTVKIDERTYWFDGKTFEEL